MNDLPRRRLNLADLTILIAATALGAVVTRYVDEMRLFGVPLSATDPTARLMRGLTLISTYSAPMLVATSLGVFIINLRRPRPSLQTLATDPGFIAPVVVVMSTNYFLIQVAIRSVSYSSVSNHFAWMFANLFHELGFHVAIAWFVLALQGNWTRRTMGTGGLGVGVGCMWIGIRVVMDLFYFLRMIYINYS